MSTAETTPARVGIDVKGGTGVAIEWADGHKSDYTFDLLRGECPCALCRDERAKDAARMKKLAVFKEKPRCVGAEAVGSYAFSLTFSDGHASGIYSYDFLRAICPCAECASRR